MIEIDFHGLCGLVPKLKDSGGLALMPRCGPHPHTTMLVARVEALGRAINGQHLTTWQPDGVGLDSEGKQTCWWHLPDGAPVFARGCRLVLRANDADIVEKAMPGSLAAPTPAAAGAAKQLDLRQQGVFVGSDKRLGRGSRVRLPESAAVDGVGLEEPYDLVAPGGVITEGPFFGTIRWRSAATAALWRLEKDDGDYEADDKAIVFNQKARLSIANVIPRFNGNSGAHHFDGLFEAAVTSMGNRPVPDNQRYALKARPPASRRAGQIGPTSVEEGVNCVPPALLP